MDTDKIEIDNTVSAGRLAQEDADRLERLRIARQTTMRRRGHKGSRTWGYYVPGGNRGKRD